MASDGWSTSSAAHSKGPRCVARSCLAVPTGNSCGRTASLISTRYALKDQAGGVVRVVSQGYRHGPGEILAALARGEEVDPARYFFRTAMRFATDAPHLDWLNKTLAVSIGERQARRVLLGVYRLL